MASGGRNRRPAMRTRALSLLLWLCAACEVVPTGMPSQGRDPLRYETCGDKESQQAYDRASVLLQSGEEREALPFLRMVIERCPDHVVAHRQYQEAAQHLRAEAEVAMRSYYRLLPDRPDSPVPAYLKAALLLTDFERAQALAKIIEHDNNFPFAHCSLARVQRRIGRLQEAADSYQRALALHRKWVEVYAELADTYVELGQYEAAAAAYDNSLRAAPDDRTNMRAYAQVLLYRLGRTSEAQALILRLQQLDPSDAATKLDFAACEWFSGNHDAAAAAYVEVLTMAQASPQLQARAAINIGNLHYDKFDKEGADRPTRELSGRKARKAYLLFLRFIRPEDGQDQFERMFAVPFRLRAIDQLLGPDDGLPPVISELK